MCGNWQQPALDTCTQCGSSDLQKRERRIHGWLGVQRYLDKADFGVDFLRNGRKILVSDKRIFEWSDPNDPTAAQLIEYPVELGQGGRLIGEIHLDHVPVNYQKNAFEFSDRGWIAAIHYLRGSGPLLPQKAKQLGYADNGSALGRLFKGYRRNDAGLRYLVPGDGKGPIHDKTREWARKFYEGVEDFQSDEVWWQAVLDHESKKKAATETKSPVAMRHPDEAAVLGALGINAESDSHVSAAGGDAAATDPSTEAASSPPPLLETEQERLARYREEGAQDIYLTGDFGTPELGFLKVTTWDLPTGPVIDSFDNPTPAWVSLGAGATADIFIDSRHDLFTKYNWTHADAVLVELAVVLRARADSTKSVMEISQSMQRTCLPDSALEIGRVAAQANELLGEIRLRMAEAVAAEPARAHQWLNPDEVISTENSIQFCRQGWTLSTSSRQRSQRRRATGGWWSSTDSTDG